MDNKKSQPEVSTIAKVIQKKLERPTRIEFGESIIKDALRQATKQIAEGKSDELTVTVDIPITVTLIPMPPTGGEEPEIPGCFEMSTSNEELADCLYGDLIPDLTIDHHLYCLALRNSLENAKSLGEKLRILARLIDEGCMVGEERFKVLTEIASVVAQLGTSDRI